MRTAKQSLGEVGEELAAQHLRQQGYEIIERNVRRPWGELDIVAKKAGELVFCEVKTLRVMSAQEAGKYALRPEDHVTYPKLLKFKKAILLYLKEKQLPLDQRWRADVIAIEIDSEGNLFDIRQVQNIIFD